ncbi:MAG: acetyl-CoA carboxylase carboxyl transferase subunit beta [Actinomycetota bacterium]|nr:acetyl-CoA carboxylase carboxyl transferase subunit beta [Actinomycetota bacterium]
MRETGVDGRSILADRGTFEPVPDGLKTRDPLGWPGYEPHAGDSTTTPESVAAGPARIGGHEVELAEFRFDFMGGSLGWVAGERLARAMERASERGVPFVLRTATGGARMQEGMVSLVQMPKMVAARDRLAHGNSPFVVLFGDPTTGGVLASLGGLADVTFAEAGATLGFAGPRVTEHFTGRSLSPSSHTAEAAFGNGMVDSLVAPGDASKLIARTLGVLAPDTPQGVTAPGPSPAAGEGGAWDVVQRARAPERPSGRALIAALSDETVDLKGDRAGHDDPGTVCAIGRLGGRTALLIATDRARASGPGAFRKVARCICVAERLGLPVVTLIDTPGADPSEESEAHGIAWSIARCLDAILGAKVPVLAVVTGEGGSGGALALAAGDVLLACEGSIFSVIAPEAAAAILWRDAARGPDAADLLKPTAGQLVELGIADSLIPSPVGAESFRAAVAYHLARLIDSGPAREERPKRRRQRWRNIGS